MTSTLKFTGIVTALFLTVFALAYFLSVRPTFASVPISSEYTATTTAFSTLYGSTLNSGAVLATSSLTLGSVVITGATTGVWNIYDATTSDPNKRKLASSSVLVASFPASTVAGTYTFDVRLNDGLLIDLQSGTVPTTTITWRR